MLRALRLITFVFVIVNTNAHNILGIFHFPARSTVVNFEILFKKLSENGHNVTVVSNFELNITEKTYKNIILGGENLASDTVILSDLNKVQHSRLSYFLNPRTLKIFSERLCVLLFASKELKDLLSVGYKVDIVILHIFQSECVYQVAKQFDCPIIGMHSTNIVTWTGDRFALPNNPSYIPNFFIGFDGKMDFFQRTINSLATWSHYFYYKYDMLALDKEIVGKYFGGQEASQLETYLYNTSIFLVNMHYTINLPRPLVPNVIEIGGIHIGKSKPPPKEIKKWIDESTHGVIYFSFGSLVKGSTMPAEKRQAFINAFRRLPQRVIWKWENDTMEGKSDNIMIGKWLPQFDILSHPNVKAFISHGGLLGTFEAVHCGVPILVMPQFGDQHTNAKAIESVGGGEVLYLSDATEEKIYTVLKKLLTPSFQQQAKELSERFRDRPMPPLETAIYWVEYVARHKGAHFMKTAAVGMPFYQYYLLDVIAFVLTVLLIFFYILFLILRTLVRLLRRSKVSSEKMKQS